ncbi:MAG: ankyrin repeat domain-containing protein [Isosphaeraceae bacterium]
MGLTIEEWLQAAERGDVEAIAVGLRGGIDLDAVRKWPDFETILNAQQSGIEYDYDAAPYDRTALDIAVSRRHHAAIRILLDHGARPDLPGFQGLTPMTRAVLYSSAPWPWEMGEWEHDPEPLRLMLEAGYRLGLKDAALRNDLDLVRQRLDEGANPDDGEWTYFGPTLALAALLGYRDMVKLLLDRGANILARNDAGMDALGYAADSGKVEVVTLLLDRGNLDPSGLLGMAARAGHADLVREMIRRRVDLHEVDCYGRTPLDWAIERGHEDIADWLRQAVTER